MNFLRILTAVAVLAVAVAWAPAQEPPPADSEAPTQPDQKKVLATVGDEEITAEQIEGALGPVPPDVSEEQVAAARERALQQMIQRELLDAYLAELPNDPNAVSDLKADIAENLEAQNVDMSVDEFLKMRGVTDADLMNQAKLGKIQEQAVDDQKVTDFIENNPVAWFDGTKVSASHILISVSPYASEEAKAATRQKLAKIAKKIADDETTFAEAAKDVSDCPSSAKGGDLGSFTYSQMVRPFATQAFSMEVGDVSDVVETDFGYHIIKVTGREPGSGKLGPQARQAARQMLVATKIDQMLTEAREDNPVTIKQ